MGADLSHVIKSRVCLMSFGKDPEGVEFGTHQRKGAERSAGNG